MEFTAKQQQTRDNRAANDAAYSAMFAKQNAAAKIEEAAREARYCELRLSGLPVDDAIEALRIELGFVNLPSVVAYDDEYISDETLEQVIEWHAPHLAR